ncbi:MAG: DUF5684 domain-containing protein [Candidatus Pacebacteria bacterium]|nr:DUF5684 domain-containing protein [Candidatus Paceibacterota bacterium]
MTQKFSFVREKTIVCFSFLVLLLVGGIGIAFAASLPAAGNSFGSAVSLSPGSYQGGALQEWQELFYSIQVGAGQSINIEARSFADSGCSIYLYNANQEEVASAYDTNPEIKWLSDTSEKYYVKIVNDATAVDSFTLNFSLNNYYDANSQTDAGDSFDRALSVGVGTYTGYLATNNGIVAETGSDEKDIYRISLKKGATYSFKLTPPSQTELTLSLYDSNRQLVQEEDSANKGGIVTLYFNPAADTTVYLSVFNYFFAYQDAIGNYGLEIKTSAAVTELYSCTDGYCDSVGEFTSKQACQTATGKTCYTSNSCDGQCSGGGGGDPTGCTKNSDCPSNATCVDGQCVGGGIVPVDVCQDECPLNETECFDNFNYNRCGNFDSDTCLEWSTPVYCGEGNKCSGGECTAATGCICSAWVGTGCESGNCPLGQAYQTRVCVPEGCDTTNQCFADPACGTIVPPGGWGNPFSFLTSFFGGLAIWGWFAGWFLLVWLALYIYMAISLQVIAKKTGTSNEWMAWVPILNILLMINIAQKPWWWIFLFLIPIVNLVIAIIIFMAIAERRGKPNWVGLLIIVPIVGIAIPGYLAFYDQGSGGKTEKTDPYAPTGTQAANKPTVGYKHACKYCDKLIPPNSSACPYCEKVNPLGPSRCPKCHEPIEKDFKVCPNCNTNLRIVCPFCNKTTFFGEHCEDCGERLLVKCPKCGQEQPPLGDTCIKCGKPLKPKK